MTPKTPEVSENTHKSIEETLTTLEQSLEAKFNLVVKALIQNINGTISEGERIDICNKLNQDGINEIRIALKSYAQQQLQEAVEEAIKIVKKSRTVDEKYGFGMREHEARAQIVTDLISTLKSKTLDK